VFRDEAFHSIRTEGAAARAGEDWRFGDDGTLTKPRIQHRDDLTAQGRTAELTPLAETANVSASSKEHVLALKRDQLRNPQTSLDGDEKEGAIAPADPSSSAGSAQKSVNLLVIEKFDDTALEALTRDRENSLAMKRVGRFRKRDVAEEGVQGGKAGVATSG
jgi:hypothetical protein